MSICSSLILYKNPIFIWIFWKYNKCAIFIYMFLCFSSTMTSCMTFLLTSRFNEENDVILHFILSSMYIPCTFTWSLYYCSQMWKSEMWTKIYIFFHFHTSQFYEALLPIIMSCVMHICLLRILYIHVCTWIISLWKFIKD